jgi:hypothetical protein
MRFYIQGSREPRPDARGVIYCDGDIDDRFRAGVDLELSHWIPNRTPAPYKADTSTEICMGFVAGGGHRGYDLAINNHVDVDGTLAMYTLVHGERALAHRETLVQAAEMGDFWAWGEPPAQAVFQSLTLLIRRLGAEQLDAHAIYQRAFDHVTALLDGRADAAVEPGLAALNESVGLIAGGDVARAVVGERLARYAIPRKLAGAGDDLARALRVPGFNAPLAADCLVWPQARARLDRERLHLVSVETDAGWHHDLWDPGYAWAETPRSWRPPGLAAQGDSNVHVLDHPALAAAVDDLARRERGAGQWTLARRVTPFSSLDGRGFPVVLAFLADARPAASSLSPDTVAAALEHIV